jgi:hypothetical protein
MTVQMSGRLPVFPGTIQECHLRIAQFVDETAALTHTLAETTDGYRYLDSRSVDLATRVQTLSEEREILRAQYTRVARDLEQMTAHLNHARACYLALSADAELLRSKNDVMTARFAAWEDAARGAVATLSSTGTDARAALATMYELGARIVAGIAPPPPPASVVLDKLLAQSLGADKHDGGEARAGPAPGGHTILPAVHHDHGAEADAHANARYHQRAWHDALATLAGHAIEQEDE